MILALLLLLAQEQPQAGLSNQQLLDIAPPGSIVYLRPGGTADPLNEQLYIRKPLTVFGRGASARNFILEGPGSGEVILHNLIASHRHWCIVDCHDQYQWAPHGSREGSFVSRGFDSVRLYHCSADGGTSYFEGADNVLIQGGYWSNLDANTTILAPGARVSIMDAVFSDESGHPSLEYARACYTSGSRLLTILAVDEIHALPNDLSMVGTGQLGTRLELDWSDIPGPSILWASVGLHGPEPNYWGGFDFLGHDRRFVRLGRRQNIPIPARHGLIGAEVTFQVQDLGGRYSRPRFVLLRP